MKDSFESNSVQPALTALPTSATAQETSPRPWLMLLISSLAAVVICGSHAVTAGANTIRASGVGYLAFSLVLFACGSAFWTRARSTSGTLYIRWSMISAATVTAALGYIPSFTQALFDTAPARQFQTACFNASEALYLLAAVLFFAGVSRSIVILDTLQAFLFMVIRFKLIYSPATRDHFTLNHLLIGQLVALCLFLVALVGCMGAATRSELTFLRILSCFFGIRLISFFLSNQVSYTWLHFTNCSLWDVPGTVLLSAFALYLLYTCDSKPRERNIQPLRHPSVAVRSLMPSFLALLNLMLGLFMLRVSIQFAAAAISICVVCQVCRTAILQSQHLHEKTRLQNRNEQLEGLATRDALTGIGNRRSLAQVYARLQQIPDQPFSILLMDIDCFKQANDTCGHLHGDNVLIALADKLAKLAGSYSGAHCARFGGDEFALLLPGLLKPQAASIAENLRVAFAAHTFGAGSTPVSLSIGVASAQAAARMPLEQIISYADEALYCAKLRGRDRVEVHSGEPPQAICETAAISSNHLQLQHDAG